MQDGAICQQIFEQRGIDSFFSHFQMVNTKEKEFVINNEILMDSIQIYRCRIMVHISFYKKQDAQLGIESVGHIGKDSNGNRSR